MKGKIETSREVIEKNQEGIQNDTIIILSLQLDLKPEKLYKKEKTL